MRDSYAETITFKNVKLLTAGKLRKLFVTHCSLLNLSDRELQMVDAHMGHSRTTSVRNYRMNLNSTETVIMAKLQKLLKPQILKEAVGKTLQEFQAVLERESFDSPQPSCSRAPATKRKFSDTSDSEMESSKELNSPRRLCAMVTPKKSVNFDKRLTYTPRTKERLFEYFRKNILEQRDPTLGEVRDYIDASKDSYLRSKGANKVRDLVRNEIKKMKKL